MTMNTAAAATESWCTRDAVTWADRYLDRQRVRLQSGWKTGPRQIPYNDFAGAAIERVYGTQCGREERQALAETISVCLSATQKPAGDLLPGDLWQDDTQTIGLADGLAHSVWDGPGKSIQAGETDCNDETPGPCC